MFRGRLRGKLKISNSVIRIIAIFEDVNGGGGEKAVSSWAAEDESGWGKEGQGPSHSSRLSVSADCSQGCSPARWERSRRIVMESGERDSKTRRL